MKSLNLLSILLLFTACSTLDMTLIEDEGNRADLDPLKLEAGINLYHCNVDLIRQRTIQNNSSEESGKEIDMPYHYLGVKLGNGLFYDANNNLYVDLIDFYGLDQTNYSIIIKKNQPLAPDLLYDKTDDEFHFKENSSLGKRISISIEENEIAINSGFFNSEIILSKIEEGFRASSRGFIGATEDSEISTLSSGGVEMRNKDDFINVSIDENGFVTFNDSVQIRKDQNDLILEFYRPMRPAKIYHFFKTNTGFVFYDETYRGVMAEKRENTIIVYLNQEETFRAILE